MGWNLCGEVRTLLVCHGESLVTEEVEEATRRPGFLVGRGRILKMCQLMNEIQRGRSGGLAGRKNED